jgi:hypothetical protein
MICAGSSVACEAAGQQRGSATPQLLAESATSVSGLERPNDGQLNLGFYGGIFLCAVYSLLVNGEAPLSQPLDLIAICTPILAVFSRMLLARRACPPTFL